MRLGIAAGANTLESLNYSALSKIPKNLLNGQLMKSLKVIL